MHGIREETFWVGAVAAMSNEAEMAYEVWAEISLLMTPKSKVKEGGRMGGQ